MVEGFFNRLGSAGTSATMSLLSSQYMVSSSPRFLHASAAMASGATSANISAAPARLHCRSMVLTLPPPWVRLAAIGMSRASGADDSIIIPWGPPTHDPWGPPADDP